MQYEHAMDYRIKLNRQTCTLGIYHIIQANNYAYESGYPSMAKKFITISTHTNPFPTHPNKAISRSTTLGVNWT